MNASTDLSYETWLLQLRKLAADQGKDYLVGERPGAHRAAYEQGLSPEEEFTVLADMAQWRGCGCGGGGG